MLLEGDARCPERGVTIRLLAEEDRRHWDEYVVNSATSSGYHLSGWKDVIEDSFGHRTYYLFAEDSESRIKGVLPLVHMKSLLFGNFVVSLPYFNYGGVCADDDEISKSLLKAAVDIATDINADHIELRHTRPASNGLPAKTHKVSMRLTLPADPEELWLSFPSKLRSQIRRPAREEMYSRLGGEEELESFFDVFSTNMRDLGTPVYSRKFFSNILRKFPDKTRISTIYSKGGEPVASGFLFGFKETLEIPWASSLRCFSQYSPNMLLYWNVLKYACENNYRVFDFGRSTAGEGTYRFKEQWGAKPVQLYWNFWMKNVGPLPELNPKNPKYQTAIKIWQKLPIGLTRLIGPRVVKNIP